MSAKVKDVMTTHVVAVKSSATFKEMAARLRQHRISAFPVVDADGKVIGVVSEADLLAKEALNGGRSDTLISGILHHKGQAKASGVTADDLMTKPPVTIGPDEPVTRAARLLYSRKVKRLPVVSADGHLLGIVSRADVLRVFSRPDDDIKREITDRVMLSEFLVDPAQFDVTVQDGIVTLGGSPETASVGHEIVGEVWHVEGVVAVRDRLAYPPDERSYVGAHF
jgi:CBS domain-containing protein